MSFDPNQGDLRDQQQPKNIQSSDSHPAIKKPQAISNPQQNSSSPDTCMLGNDIFKIGDKWNPTLPGFGLQICVQCNCTVKQRKGRHETRVNCRRLSNDCPSIDLCPDGRQPVTIAGQCCKSC